MADLNTLNIQISASTTKADAAIDKLIGAFSRLNTALNSYSDQSDYVRGLANLSSGLSEVSSAVSSIDVDKINSVSSAVGSLASSGAKLSDINISSGLQSLEGLSITAEQFSGVKMLADSMGKLGGKGAVAAVDAIPRLSEAMRSLPTSVPAIAGISELATGLRSLGSGQVVHAAEALPRIVLSLQSLGSITIPSPAGLVEVGNAIRAFGSAAAVHAAENLPGLAASLGSLMSTLAAAPSVSRNTVNLVSALAQLAANGNRASSAMRSLTSGTNLFGSSARRASKHSKGLASTIGSLYAKFFLLIRAFRSIKSAIGYAADLREVQNVVSTTFGASTEKVQEFADTAIMSFGMSELSAKQFASRFQAMGAAMGVSTERVAKANEFLTNKLSGHERAYDSLGNSMADVSINLTKLTADMASFYNTDYNDVAEDLQAVFTGMTRPLRKYGLDLTQATLKEWALANGLEADISKMSQAEKTMLRYQYVMANMGHVMGDFTKTADTWANVVRTIGQQFQKLGQIIGQGFINALKPAMIVFRDFMNTIIDLAEKALNAIGHLLGWQVEIEDVGVSMEDGMEDYNDSLDDAGDKAKKLKTMLLGIDELNLLPDNSDDGSGGGGGASGGGGSISDNGGGIHFEPYESDIDSWFEFGERIGKKLIEAMRNIDWDKAFEKARNFGKNLAEFLNGLISPELFYELGKTIANSINTAIYAALAFGENFDWKDFGRSIAAGINGFFENIDLIAAADTINTWANGILDALIEALDHVKWDEVGEKIGDFLERIDFLTIFKKVAIAIWKALSGALSMYDSMFDSAPVETAILTLVGFTKLLKIGGITKFTKAIKGIYGPFSKFSTELASGSGFLAALGNSFTGLQKPIESATHAINLYRLGVDSGALSKTGAFNMAISDLTKNLSPLTKGLIGVGSGVADFALVSDAVHDLASGTENVGANIAELFAGITAGAVGLTAVLGFPAGLAAAIGITLVGAISGAHKAMEEAHFERIGETIKASFDNGGTPISEVVDSLTGSLNASSNQLSEFNTKAQEFENTRNRISEVWQEIDKIKTSMDNGVISVSEGKEQLSTLFTELATLTTTQFDQISDSINSLYGEGGAFENVYSDSEGLVNATLEAQYTNIEAAKEYADILNTAEPYSDEWNKAYQALKDLNPSLDQAAKAFSDFQYTINGIDIDYSKFIMDDGTVDISAVEATLGEMQNAYESYSTNLDEVGKEVKAQLEALYNSTADQEQKAQFKKALDELPANIASMKEDAVTELQTLTDNMQTAFLDTIPGIVEAGQADWESFKDEHPLQALFFWGNDEDKYVKDYTDNITGSIGQVSDAIETSFSGMGIDGAGWSRGAADDIMDALYDEFTIYNGAGQTTVTHLSDNVRGVFDDVVKNVKGYGYDSFKVMGEDADQGQADGITGKKDVVTKATSGLEEDVIDTAKTSLDSHSPSRVFEEIGKNQDEGQEKGIRENISLVLNAVRDLISEMLSNFDGLPNQMYGIGSDIGNNLANGISSALGNIRRVIGDIADSITDVMKGIDGLNNANIRTDLDFGKTKGYAMGGYPSTGSLFIANEAGPEMVGTIGNRTAVVNNGQIVESIKAGVYEAMASAMANGGSNVSVVLEGDTASFFSAIVRENNREIMRTGKSRLRN